jgi:pyridoxamine 5'-phosphate oxidase
MLEQDLTRLRREYADRGIEVTQFTADPLGQFGRWFDEVDASVPKSDTQSFEPNAMVLSTADLTGRPSSRTVLLKRYGTEGFTFFTNLNSHKAADIGTNPQASLLFPWYPLHRQVIVAGRVERLTAEANDEYFAVRPRGSQLGAWASDQSTEIADRRLLEDRYAEYERRFPDRVPRPEHWGGLRVVPDAVEFWQGRAGRLHDRLEYRRDAGPGAGLDSWSLRRLSP